MPVSDEYQLKNESELLMRQVIEQWVQEGRPISRAFRPNSGDSGLLSSDRSSKITPREAFEAYLARPRQSAGVWGVTVSEYAGAGLKSYDDPLADNQAHAVVDFSGLSEAEQRTASKKLFANAVDRGCLHPVGDII